MAGYLNTLDTHYDDLSSHCTHLNSRVESLEQQVKELKKEKASLQECLDIAEGEEANTREAYRTLKMDYDKKLKKLAPQRKSGRKPRAKDARQKGGRKLPQHQLSPGWRICPISRTCPSLALMIFSRNLGTL
jgi:chromosome segregation ATPase